MDGVSAKLTVSILTVGILLYPPFQFGGNQIGLPNETLYFDNGHIMIVSMLYIN